MCTHITSNQGQQMPDDDGQPYDRGPAPTRWGVVIALVALAAALALLIYIAI